jgi:hypothetical protein
MNDSATLISSGREVWTPLPLTVHKKTMPGLLARRGDLFQKVFTKRQEIGTLRLGRWGTTCNLQLKDLPAGHQ